MSRNPYAVAVTVLQSVLQLFCGRLLDFDCAREYRPDHLASRFSYTRYLVVVSSTLSASLLWAQQRGT